MNQLVMRDFPTKRGYMVCLTGNGRLVLSEYLRNPNGIRLILIDGGMPEMNGLKATRLICRGKRAQGWPRVPIVVPIAHILDEHRQTRIEAGIDAHLGELMDWAELCVALERLLSRFSRQA